MHKYILCSTYLIGTYNKIRYTIMCVCVCVCVTVITYSGVRLMTIFN